MPKDNIERAIKKARGRRRRELRRDPLRGLWAGRRRRDRRGARPTTEPHGVRCALRPSPRTAAISAETGAVSFMFDHVGVIEFDAKVGQRRRDAGSRDRGRRRRRRVERETATRSTPRTDRCAKSRRRWRRKFGEPRKAALIWKPQNTDRGRRRERRQAAEADRNAQRSRRRAERLRQFRNLRRADGEAECVRPWRYRESTSWTNSPLHLCRQ